MTPCASKYCVDACIFHVQVDSMLQSSNSTDRIIQRGTLRATAIKLSSVQSGPEAIAPQVQVLRVGKFNHPKYGEFEITPLTLQELKKNFDANIRGVDIAIDYFHKSDEEAAGWIEELYLSEDGSELWAKVDWTSEAEKKLSEREIRYFSPDFAFKWTDPETGKQFNNVLFGGGLTNRPFVKDMAAIVADEKGEQMTLAELAEKVLKLDESNSDLAKKHADLMEKHAALQAEHADMKKKLGEMPAPAKAEGGEGEPDGDEAESEDPAELKKQLGEAKAKLAEYAENAKKAEEAKQMAEKETQFTVLMSEGKACAAQKDAFMKGDMGAFVKLSQPVNLEGKGSAANGGEVTGDREDRVLKLAEEKCKANPKLGRVEAISLANKEVK